MAFLRHEFFESNLSVGSASRCSLEAIDGEFELDIELPPEERLHFTYKFYHSTSDDDAQSYDKTQFELSQFVLLQQLDGKLLCKVQIAL